MSRNSILELLEKLRPMMKDEREGERLYNLWLIESREGREWIEQMLEIEYSKQIKPFERHQLLLPPPPRSHAKGRFHLGDVIYNDRVLHPFGIPDASSLLQHTAIFGRSGAGKTNLLFKILHELTKAHVPYWIFDWKRDYRPLLKEYSASTLVYTIGRKPCPLGFNPLIPPRNCHEDVERYINKIVDIICRSFYVGHGVKSLLTKAFRACEQKWKSNPHEPPTFQAALKWIRDYQPGKHSSGRRAHDWKESTIRALEQLCMGEFGRSLNVVHGIDLESILDWNVIFELDGLSADQKSFFVETLLLWRREHALARLDTDKRDQLRSMLIIEEAHNIIKTGTEKNANETILEVTLRETRSLGMGIILLDQTPSLISQVATANTFTNVFFSLQGRSNINAAASTLLLSDDQKDFLGRLPVGRAICKMADHWTDPFLLQVPLMKIKQAVISDKDLHEHMARMNERIDGLSSCSAPEGSLIPESEVIPLVFATAKEGITEEEKSFLVDVVKRPTAGIANRYKKLGVSTRNGNKIRESIEAKGLAKMHSINTGKAQVKIPELTTEGAEYLRDLGHDVNSNGTRGSTEHRYWTLRLADHFRRSGYDVAIEKRLENNHRVDVEAVKGAEKIAIEIETGKSDPSNNINKLIDYRYSRIILVPTSFAAMRQCMSAKEGSDCVEVIPAREF